MKQFNRQQGNQGEKIAAKYLAGKGFKIIETNFYTKWGEIDIIAFKDQRLHFIEVKTRTSLRFGRPEAAVTRNKYQKAKRAVIIYLRQNPQFRNTIFQIDVIAIMHDQSGHQAKIRYFPNILLK